MSAPGVEKRTILYEKLQSALPQQLPAYLIAQRWFGGKARQIHAIRLLDLIPLQTGRIDAFVLLAQVEYQIGQPETYVLPLAVSDPSSGRPVGEAIVFQLHDGPGSDSLVLLDVLQNSPFLSWLLDAIEVRLVAKGMKGEIRASFTDIFQAIRSNAGDALQPRLLKGEQSNNSIAYGDRLILKFFRRVEEGLNPDLEIGLFLTEKARFPNVPSVAGSFEYRAEGVPVTLGILQEFVPNQGDAWRFTLDQLQEFWPETAKYSDGLHNLTASSSNPVLDYDAGLPNLATQIIGPYLEKVELLAKRTAQLHLALASDSADPTFAPEPYTSSFQNGLELSARELAARNFELLRQKLQDLSENARGRASGILQRERDITERLHSPLPPERSGMRTRIHGDYHLGQVLYTGSDFMIIDFEGEPARPLSERRTKRSPLQDVAGMVRSFHYAAFSHLLGPHDASTSSDAHARTLANWAEGWYVWVVRTFLRSYFRVAQSGSFLPSSREEISALLQIHLLEKAIYELGYELNNRPSWVGIPLAGISQLLA